MADGFDGSAAKVVFTAAANLLETLTVVPATVDSIFKLEVVAASPNLLTTHSVFSEGVVPQFNALSFAICETAVSKIDSF